MFYAKRESLPLRTQLSINQASRQIDEMRMEELIEFSKSLFVLYKIQQANLEEALKRDLLNSASIDNFTSMAEDFLREMKGGAEEETE